MCIEIIASHKVRVTRLGVRLFNAQWPSSELRDTRSYWFEFDENGSLIDSDVPHTDEGAASLAMSKDAEAFLVDGLLPAWVEV